VGWTSSSVFTAGISETATVGQTPNDLGGLQVQQSGTCSSKEEKSQGESRSGDHLAAVHLYVQRNEYVLAIIPFASPY
jgi:hypothetical protein